LIKDFPVQFLAADGLTEEAVREAREKSNMKASRQRSFGRNNIIAVAASVGRYNDLARIEQLLEQAKIDKPLLDDILRRHNLTLPTKRKPNSVESSRCCPSKKRFAKSAN
jgi:hypothetical protein